MVWLKESVELVLDLFGVVYGYSSSYEGKVKEERKEMFYMWIG